MFGGHEEVVNMSDYAPDPKKQLVYDNLQTKTLANVTALDIQRLTDPTFIQATNQDALLTYNIVNKAAMRDGSAIPETMVIGVGTTTDSGVGVNIFTPQRGEVWAIQSASATLTGRSGNVIHELYWVDNANSREVLWYYNESGNTIQIFSDDDNWLGDKIQDSNITLKYEATGTFTNSVISILLYRVR